MGRVLFQNAAVICTMIFLCVSLVMTLESSDLSGGTEHQPAVAFNSGDSESETAHELLASNDFCFSHRSGKDESLHHTLIVPLRAEKMLRESIFDREKIIILSQTLKWFTHKAYRATLSPLWQPSIIIAHRRLIV